MDLTEWIAQITDRSSAHEIATAAHLPLRTVQHQLSTGRMSLENRVRIGVTYGHHPLRTLIEWEIVNPEWERVPDIDAALRLASEEKLADEVLRRMKLGTKTDALTTPIDELEARRSNARRGNVTTAGYDDGTVHEWDDTLPNAADSSPDEQQIREEEGEDPID